MTKGISIEQSVMKRLCDGIVDTPLRLFLHLLRLLPYKTQVILGGWFMRRLVIKFTDYQGRIISNLNLVRSELTDVERAKIVTGCLDNCGRMFAEHNAAKQFVDHVKDSKLKGPGLDRLREAHQTGQGIVFATGHFGNFEAGRSVLIDQVKNWQQGQFPSDSEQRTQLIKKNWILGGLYRPTNNVVYERHHLASFSYIGEPAFPKSVTGLRDMVTFLASSGWVMVLHDQHDSYGIPISFLGAEANTSTSAARLALRSNALLVPFYGIRLANGFDFEIVVEDPIEPSSAEKMTRQLSRSLERMVDRHPEQWFWIHLRWRV